MPGMKGRVWRRTRVKVLELFGATCWRCLREIDLTLDPNDRWALTIDHLRARVNGGSKYSLENLRPMHRSCNSRKGARVERPSVRTTAEW